MRYFLLVLGLFLYGCPKPAPEVKAAEEAPAAVEAEAPTTPAEEAPAVEAEADAKPEKKEKKDKPEKPEGE
jgi:hypothetical protein